MTNDELFNEAQQFIPGGVNSPVRAFRQVGGTPVFFERAQGAYLYDTSGTRYIDYIGSWGPMVIGHRHESVVTAVEAQLRKGFSFGAPTVIETAIAKKMAGMCPNVDMIRMVNSGTEACMSAVRLARGFTGRSKILKFEGHYHGHADLFLKKAGSGVATLGIKVPGGVPEAVIADTLVTPFNDVKAVEQIVARHGNEMAAIIVEPVAGNMGCVPPVAGYLQLLRELCSHHGILLIFDEVMTGFRLAKGGAQELFSVNADIVTYGKVIGGGMPVGAFGGRREIMQKVAPLGDVYQAGTLSGNPVAMSAGLATLNVIDAAAGIFKALENYTSTLADEIRKISSAAHAPVVVNQMGSMLSVHFCDTSVQNFEDAKRGDNETFRKFFHHMLKNGIYLPPSPYESWFVSAAHSEQDLAATISAVKDFFE
jgi:glutamate-1-semialdehyde 2,1-aminomutase